MTIQRRILKSNTWIVLLSLFTLLIIGGTVIFIFEDTYIKTLSVNSKIQENTYDVQTLMNQYKLTGKELTEADYERLKSLLKHYDYQLIVTDGNDQLYSNLLHNQQEALKILQPEVTFADRSAIYVWEDKTMIARKLSGEVKDYKIVAINSSVKEGVFRLNRGTFELLILSFLIVGFGTILVIMCISRIFTQRLVNHIMRPIKKLTDGVERIEQGNLEEPIIYAGEDEFEMVCRAFNKMQKSLKEGMETNAAYERARTDLISGISHDLRTPLTSVKGFIKGVKDGIANTPEKQEQYLDIAYKKACDMEVLLQKLFYYSKFETGNMPLYPVKTDFLSFVDEFMKENKEYYRENNLFVTISATGDSHEVTIDKEQVSRVIANIIDNSIKYRIHDEVKINVEIAGLPDREILTITDDGGGVSEEKLPHLFEQFYRADEARSSKKVGSGLGLYISKHIIEQHGGKVEAKNNNGLSIVITLPKSEE